MALRPKALPGLGLNSLKSLPFLGLVKDQAVAAATQPIENNTSNINYLDLPYDKDIEDISIYKNIPELLGSCNMYLT